MGEEWIFGFSLCSCVTKIQNITLPNLLYVLRLQEKCTFIKYTTEDKEFYVASRVYNTRQIYKIHLQFLGILTN